MNAEEFAKRQKEISIAEFFEKNKHILGYSNPAKSLITCVKEAVDNSLDACEDAGILPDILVKISKVEKSIYRVVIEDNGPGIVKEQIPKIFGKLLYGSRFHSIRQSRGQQGIGISGAVLYAQLTTGKPAVITSKTNPKSKAIRLKLFIDTKKNQPEIVAEEEIEWYYPRGTRIELELEGAYVKERKQSVLEYLSETSVVNPHAKITFVDPDGEIFEFNRLIDEIPKPPKEILPHPHGIEFGKLMWMLRTTKASTLKNFMKTEFVRVGDKKAEEVIAKAGLDPNRDPRELTREEIARLYSAFSDTEFLPPPTDCLSPIGEKNIMNSLISRYGVEWAHAITRKPKVYSGNPFLVEVGIGYGGELRGDDKVKLLRFANKIPLVYAQGGCALTKAVESINWKNYGLTQSRNELPIAPAVILIHVASTNIPYTSESKEAIASIPEIYDEIRLALQEAGRKLKEHIERKEKLKKKKSKEVVLNKILPLLAKKVCEVLERDEIDVNRVVAKIMGNVYIERTIKDGNVEIGIFNYSSAKKAFKVIEICSGKIECDDGKISTAGDTKTILWDVSLNPGESITLSYSLNGRIINRKPYVEGLDQEILSGGEVMSF
ncbi:DNA topoisomerase VI, B subunit [Archaeoglobus sulfaticallidus PM70-1]|uniref:Type 2 DNA topoisomerase 6 subunit B n=1 Tax=Archaeoglobus sulfaticallidus PM70-1 TaxID=387631 RepID=N0BED3_9EURY|nr:DNA topoisomerase VI subunit B [Archaeoglobus sulfaticallidus]AGK61974.1 DNA topoisomerase VI, B subunit [Archaeoglobus sulfaticallidus PM70-1]